MRKEQANNTARSPIVRAGERSNVRAGGVSCDVDDGGILDVVTAGPDVGPGVAMGMGALPTVPISDKLARVRARDRVEMPVNLKLQQARADLDASVAARALTNWEVAMIESMIDLRDLQDVIDAMSELQDVIRENVKQALAGGEAKTFKTSLGSATLAKGAETVTIVDEKKIPFAYMISTPDKAKIGKALRVPIDVDGAKLTEGKPSLRISWED